MLRPLLLLVLLVSACSGGTEPAYVAPSYAEAAGVWSLQVSDTAGCGTAADSSFIITLRLPADVSDSLTLDNGYYFDYTVPDSASWVSDDKSGYLAGYVNVILDRFFLSLGTGPYNGSLPALDTTARAYLDATYDTTGALAGVLVDPENDHAEMAHHPIFAAGACSFRVRGSRTARL